MNPLERCFNDYEKCLKRCCHLDRLAAASGHPHPDIGFLPICPLTVDPVEAVVEGYIITHRDGPTRFMDSSWVGKSTPKDSDIPLIRNRKIRGTVRQRTIDTFGCVSQ